MGFLDRVKQHQKQLDENEERRRAAQAKEEEDRTRVLEEYETEVRHLVEECIRLADLANGTLRPGITIDKGTDGRATFHYRGHFAEVGHHNTGSSSRTYAVVNRGSIDQLTSARRRGLEPERVPLAVGTDGSLVWLHAGTSRSSAKLAEWLFDVLLADAKSS